MKSWPKKRQNKSVFFQGGYDYNNTKDYILAVIYAWSARKYWQTEKIGLLKNNLSLPAVPAKTVLSSQPPFHFRLGHKWPSRSFLFRCQYLKVHRFFFKMAGKSGKYAGYCHA